MPHYKDTENKLHWLDDAGHEYLLPTGSVQITDEEAESLRPQPPAPTYAELRAAEYPSIPDQLDTLYHGGYDAWKATIQAVKDKYPKE
jgi:hypothetical protein